MVYEPQAIVAARAAHYLVEMSAVGVCDENLSEVVGSDERYDALHPCGVELVENIVEQQERPHSGGFAEKFILGEAESGGESLA